jgi:hypothetical protein
MKLLLLALTFNYTEFIDSDTAIIYGIQNLPNHEQLGNGKALYLNIIQPIRDHFGGVKVTSAYRNLKLNTLVGGSVDSQHMSGQAVDIQIPEHNRFDVAEWIMKNLEYDQMIVEPSWIHISYSQTNNRNQNLKYSNGSYSPILYK